MIQSAPVDATFVEYGMGGSTHLAAQLVRGTQTWHSLEHTKAWFDKVLYCYYRSVSYYHVIGAWFDKVAISCYQLLAKVDWSTI